ncbi:biotin transporter BioY [Adlercreutzia aquisgranensis]|uniref:biotin transporter BioY n=1 Tax=Adlercreutzia aquisgranensis TaxID=2941323 RepID=UPI00203BD9A3|nr:biotin transporter BioY [Adlercreutzia aquisgranensis]
MNETPARTSAPTHESLKGTVYCALFTALIIVGGYISIPIGPVPIAFADFFVMMAALFLGPKRALASVALYIALGALGLPVFAGGKAGLAVLAGPTGGFLVGYLLMALIAGAIAVKAGRRPLAMLLALVVGNAALYAFGVPWLKFQMGIDWTAALAGGLTPFVPGIVVKIALATALAAPLVSRVAPALRKDDADVPAGNA